MIICDPDRVTIHYKGSLVDGTIFISSGYKLVCVPLCRWFTLSSFNSGPLQTVIGVGNLIRGWDEGYFCSLSQWTLWCRIVGVLQLSIGQQAILTMSPDFVRLYYQLLNNLSYLHLSVARHMVPGDLGHWYLVMRLWNLRWNYSRSTENDCFLVLKLMCDQLVHH